MYGAPKTASLCKLCICLRPHGRISGSLARMDTDSIQTAKKDTRAKALAARDAIPFVDRLERSAEICDKIGTLLREELPDVLTEESLSQPTAIPSPQLPYTRPNIPAKTTATSDDPDAPLACHVGQEWMFEQPTGRPEGDKPMLALYSSMKSEVDLSELAHGAFAHEWRVCFPAMIAEEGDVDTAEEPRRHMEFFEVSWAQLKALVESFMTKQLRTYTVTQLEADGFRKVDAAEIRAMVVPMVAFDADNNRLGYGGGNYDRYLPLLSEGTVIIGAAFDEQQVEHIPTGDFDLPLPHIVHA